MCVAALAWDSHPDWLLVCAGNRDELHARPAAPLARWDDGSGMIAGRDLTGGGTWLGVTEAGRFALVTNYRTPEGSQAHRPSRGRLVTNYRTPEGSQAHRPSRGRLVTDLLAGREPEDMAAMNAFNLVLVADRAATFLTNHPRIERRSLAAGTHGLSNGGFDVPWPKTVRLQQALEQWLARGESDFGFLFEALRQETPAPGADGEPRLAPVFIRNPAYGTRCSTVLAIGRDGQGMIAERSFSPDGAPAGERTENFRWF